MISLTIYIILKTGVTINRHEYVTCFISKKEAEDYVYSNPECYVRHESKEMKQ